MVDKKGKMHEHTEIKLELYRLYLARYLSVLSNYGKYSQITVHDIFAGKGHSTEGKSGSPIIGAEEILKIIERFPKTKIFLKLNDNDPEKVEQLKTHLKTFPFASVSEFEANDYIQNFRPSKNTQNLFFIDPHGYTQVSIANLKKLFTQEHCDFLIFIPITHIYRFLKQKENSPQYRPIAYFLSHLGIGGKEANSVKSVIEFSDLVMENLKKIARTDYGYPHILMNKKNSNRYCLYFLTGHILGAKLFLEARENLKEQIRNADTQLSFSFPEIHERPSIFEKIEKNKKYTNNELYNLAIITGILPKFLNEELRELAKINKIKVSPFSEQKTRKGSYYIGYKYFKNRDDRIYITFGG